jgi:hypothetical protein
MSWASIADNQCVSWNNMQDACDNLLFFYLQPLPVPSTKQITKQEFTDYIYNPIPLYPPFYTKLNNQLIVKDNVWISGNITMEPNYGLYFTYTTSYTFYGFTFPVTSTATQIYYQLQTSDTGTYGFGFEVGVDGTISSPSGFAHLELSVDGEIIDTADFFSSSGPQYTLISLINTVYAPSNITLKIVDGYVVYVPPDLQSPPFNNVAVSKNTGQYMLASAGTDYNGYCGGSNTAGYLYRTSDYGTTWFQLGRFGGFGYGWWADIAISGDGQYMLAVELSGYAYLSTDNGANWNQISALPQGPYTGCAISGDGQYQTIVGQITGSGSYLYRSLDYGVNWTAVSQFQTSGAFPNNDFTGVAMSSSGSYQTLITQIDPSNFEAGFVFRSSNGTSNPANFYVATVPGSFDPRYYDVTCSPDGAKQFVAGQRATTANSYPFMLYKSTNYGVNFVEVGNSLPWIKSAVNDTSISFGIVCGNDYIKVINASNVISNLTASGARNWRCIDVSNGGAYILAGAINGLFLSTDYGTTFTAL